MDARRIKIEIGPHKIEAEGLSKEKSDERLALFKELVLASLGQSAEPSSDHKPDRKTKGKQGAPETHPQSSDPLAQLFKREDTIVSLTDPPQGQNRAADGFLLVLLGQKIMRDCEWAGVSDVKSGLNHSGISVDRVDTVTTTVSADLYMKRGERRASQFKLTNPGVQKARELAEAILAKIS
jgi:hypothetical protein